MGNNIREVEVDLYFYLSVPNSLNLEEDNHGNAQVR